MRLHSPCDDGHRQSLKGDRSQRNHGTGQHAVCGSADPTTRYFPCHRQGRPAPQDRGPVLSPEEAAKTERYRSV
jgi:hypothetical protein